MAEPDLIRNILTAAAQKWGIAYPMQTARLFSDWEHIVGEQVAAKCMPVSVKNGVLKVKTTSPAWASEFRYLAPEAIKRINAELGVEVVMEIRPCIDASVSGESGPASGKPGRRRSGLARRNPPGNTPAEPRA